MKLLLISWLFSFFHVDEPRISLPETFGACVGIPVKLNVTLHDNNHEIPHYWRVDWYMIKYIKNKKKRWRNAWNSVTLTIYNPEVNDSGKIYEAEVSNRFGLARAVTRLFVTEGKLFDEFSLVISLKSV